MKKKLLMKTVILNRDTAGLLSFLLTVPASGGEPFKRGAGITARGRWGENSAVPRQGDGAGGMCSQEPEVGWGSRGFVSFVGLEPMLNRIALSARLSPTLLC